MPIKVTRALLNAALSGDLDGITCRVDPIFGFEVPLAAPNVADGILDPRSTWADPAAYDATADKLARQFAENFRQFEDAVDARVVAAGPRALSDA